MAYCVVVKSAYAHGELIRKWTYHRRSEGPVQPTSPLTNELSRGLRHISLRLTGLDVRQCPLVVRLRNQLETENTVLSQEHVLGEDVHAVDTLGAQTICERMVAMEVLIKRTAEDSAEPVC